MTAPLAPAYRTWREALAAYNDPTFPDSEENARAEAYHQAYDSMMDAEILTDEDAKAAAALAIDLLNDGQDEDCADVLEDIQEYFTKNGRH
jgi:hypothetical protein